MAYPVFIRLVQRGQKRWAAYRRASDGSAAVEFAIVAIPFFFLLLGLIEVCMIFIMSTILENAVQESARPIRTGDVQSGGMNAADFRTSVCDQLMSLLNCNENLHIDVRTLSNFGAGVPPRAIDEDGNLDTSGFTYQLGGPNDIVSVRVFYEWGLITPILSKPLSNLSGNKHLLSSATVFRTEPYSS